MLNKKAAIVFATAAFVAGCTTDPFTGDRKLSNTAGGALIGAGVGTVAGLVIGGGGNRNAAFGNVAAVPGEFTENRQYYVVDSDSAGSFNLAATVGGSAIMGTDPVIGSEIQRLYAGRMTGVLSSGLRKIATDSYMNRCSAGTCSCSGKDGNAFMQEPHLRKLMWRPILECA